MPSHANGDHGVASLAAVGAWVALALQSDLFAVLHPGGDFDVEHPAGWQNDAAVAAERRLFQRYRDGSRDVVAFWRRLFRSRARSTAPAE
jgi:hypothetical protein